ncbi:hypothetical protein [Micromonospora avicenniae]|uniref:Uncharacterized protein n=1 Tax=Micromonospora avicenniae TaxID=1198245 RepID=A0A1N7AY08_9ACTN|nr:hypothetical protein [Micromonospora avicenniae]SIR43878.1 hypothetical protein SAMN05444858_11011 [Micromonospora avicenniae]
MTHRSLPAVAVLVVAVALTAGCGDGNRPTNAAVASSTPTTSPSPVVPPPVAGAPVAGPSSGPAAPVVPPAGDAPAVQEPTERRPASPPPVVLPRRPAGAPGAKQVVDAFRAAGLKVPNPRDLSVDCGPDGLGLGCSEIIATDAVTVYVFPDETSASDIAEIWSGQSYRRGAVVLNYLAARTPAADRLRYEKVLAGLG